MPGPADIKLSKRLSLALRHAPETLGLTLDSGGWADVDAVLKGLGDTSREGLEALVAQSDKQRFALSPDGSRIRANQGHSIPVDLGLTPRTPPAQLYHGTVARALPGIRAQGLTRQKRHHVHLSPDRETAARVGARRGPPIILTIQAGEMAAQNHLFWCSENGVWLTDQVPPIFITFP